MGGGHRPERSGQDDASEGDRAARALRGRDRARRPADELDAPGGALSAGGSRGAGSLDAPVDDRRRVRPARADAASRSAREGREARPGCGRARSRPPRSLRVRRASARDALGRREAARRRRPSPRAGGEDRPPRRADRGPRHRAPAAGARAAGRAAEPSRSSPSSLRCTTSPWPRSTPSGCRRSTRDREASEVGSARTGRRLRDEGVSTSP